MSSRNGCVRIGDEVIKTVAKFYRDVQRNMDNSYLVIDAQRADGIIMISRQKINTWDVRTIRRVMQAICGRSIAEI
jgi:hypothetical protein